MTAATDAAKAEWEGKMATKRNKVIQKDKIWKELPAPDFEKPVLTIHGDTNVSHMLVCARRFVFRKGMPLRVNEIEKQLRENEGKEDKQDWTPTWKDDNINLWSMAIEPEGATKADGPLPTPGYQRLRKRSFDEIDEDGIMEEVTPAQPSTNHGDDIRQTIISEMFESTWHMGKMNEYPIDEVEVGTPMFLKSEAGNFIPYKPNASKTIDKVWVRTPWPGATITSLPPTNRSTLALSYILKTHPRRGKFQVAEANRLGVPPRMSTNLTSGRNVTLENGTVVTPDMVLGEKKPGAGIAVVDLPDRTYLKNLLARKEWEAEEVMTGIEGIVWILGKGVGEEPELLAFMKKMSHLTVWLLLSRCGVQALTLVYVAHDIVSRTGWELYLHGQRDWDGCATESDQLATLSDSFT